jgi:hypothetical protein
MQIKLNINILQTFSHNFNTKRFKSFSCFRELKFNLATLVLFREADIRVQTEQLKLIYLKPLFGFIESLLAMYDE